MKTIILRIFILSVLLTGCGKTNHEHHDGEENAMEHDEEATLSDELDKIHNEAMSKMGELLTLKRELKNKIDSSASMVKEKKEELQTTINTMDSAYENMMDWMHKYNPDTFASDSVAYHEYLETEMEKIKKIKNDIQDAIRRAKEENQ